MKYHESNYAEHERAAYQRGDVALARLLADCADLHKALEWIADQGADEVCPECTAARYCACVALAKVAA